MNYLLCSTPFAHSVTMAFINNVSSAERVEIAYSGSLFRISAGDNVPFMFFHGNSWHFRGGVYDDGNSFEDFQFHRYYGDNRQKKISGQEENNWSGTLYLDLSYCQNSSAQYLWGKEMPIMKELVVEGCKDTALSNFFDFSWNPSMLESLTVLGVPFHTVFLMVSPDQFVNLKAIRFQPARDNLARRDSLFLRKLIATMKSNPKFREVTIIGSWREYIEVDEILRLGEYVAFITLLDNEDWEDSAAERQSITTDQLTQLDNNLPYLHVLIIDFDLPTVSVSWNFKHQALLIWCTSSFVMLTNST